MKVIIKITEMPAGDIQIDVGSEGSEAASTEELKCGAHVVRAFNICLPLIRRRYSGEDERN